MATGGSASFHRTRRTPHDFARASGVPETQLVTVKGGEDFQFGGFSLRVIPSLHGVLPRPRAPLTTRPEVFSADAKPPFRLPQLLVEGGTLVGSEASHWTSTRL